MDDARDLWSILTEEQVENSENGGGGNAVADGSSGSTGTKASQSKETFVLFVGDKQCGKSTAVNMFLNPTKDEKPKPTVALEYTFGRKSNASGSAKDVAHIWELGGGQKLSDLIKVPMSTERIERFHIIVCVSLEKPNQAIDSLKGWIDIVRSHAADCVDELRRTRVGSKTAARMAEKRKVPFASHAEMHQMDICPVPLTVVCTKYDKFANQDPLKRKVLLSALRYIAFSNGASIYCVSRPDKTLQQYFRGVMGSYCFGGSLRKGHQLDSAKPLVVNFGMDSLKQIGLPPGASAADFEDGNINSLGRVRFSKWKAAVEERYPKNTLEDEMDAIVSDFDNQEFQEEKIDAARVEKDHELAQYKHEAERKLRIAEEMAKEGPKKKSKPSKEKRSKKERPSRSSEMDVRGDAEPKAAAPPMRKK